ncbi:MFS transporter [Arthrobacter mobilis]|uniref:MFS transporter n=1 Tax=Arthrobacter mobilis TaxID=2724944 RepID=A0A7X6HEE6_9MICC|nr:MFS transporter [Arthrobacter mobilis]NKX55603.1 MFS transporter [Arthrobacter mobilis]
MTPHPDALPRLSPQALAAISGTFVVGYMIANVIPLIIAAMEADLGLEPVAAGALGTAMMLCSAASGTLLARRASRPNRYKLARAGLLVMAAGSLVAALAPLPWLAVAGVVVAGLGAGAGIASGGAAIAATADPDRTSGLAALVNRLLAALLLLVVPLFGISMASSFLALAALALLGALICRPLPEAPAAAGHLPVAVDRRTRILGLVLAAGACLWAVGEDSLWAMSSGMGVDQAGLDGPGIGLLLSISTAAGLAGILVATVLGSRLGRVVPLAVLLVLGAAAKLVTATTGDPAVFGTAFIAWNTIYAATFVTIVALSAAVHSSGRYAALLTSVYLFGSALSPLFGAALVEAAGYAGFGLSTALISAAVAVPFLWVAVSLRRQPAPSSVPEEQFDAR